jgi:hypothetical protein
VLSSSACPPVLVFARRSQFDIPLNQLLHRLKGFMLWGSPPQFVLKKNYFINRVCLVRLLKNNDASILQHLDILLVETIKSTILGILQNQKHIRTLTQIWETHKTTHRVTCTLEIKTTVVFTFVLRLPLHHLSHTTVRATDQWKAA